MYRWFLQLSPGTVCKYLLFFLFYACTIRSHPFFLFFFFFYFEIWLYIRILFLAKLNVSVTVALLLFHPNPPPPFLSVSLFNFFIICVWVYVFVEGRDSQTLHWWLFSWFIIINHCYDSFIQPVLCHWDKLQKTHSPAYQCWRRPDHVTRVFWKSPLNLT